MGWLTMIDRHPHRGLAVFAGRTERHDVSVLIGAGLAFFSDGVPFGQPPQDRRLVYPHVVSFQKNDELANPAAKATWATGRSVVSSSTRAVWLRWARARASGPVPTSAVRRRLSWRVL